MSFVSILSARIVSFLRASWLRIAIIGIALAFALFFASDFFMDANKDSANSSQRHIKIVEVDRQDAADVKRWAESICRGRTVSAVASVLRLEPSMEAVIEYLGKGLNGESREIVIEVCKRELK